MATTYALQRIDPRKLGEALAALAAAREASEPGPLLPWLEDWRAESCARGQGSAQDFRALLVPCAVGKVVDLLDRTPAALAGRQADQDLRCALLGLELGGGLEPWMRETDEEGVEAHEAVLGLLRGEDVKRLCPRVGALPPRALFLDEEELSTYGEAWERVKRAFAVALERGEGLVLLRKTS